jgi:hypothetical protein
MVVATRAASVRDGVLSSVMIGSKCVDAMATLNGYRLNHVTSPLTAV